MFAVLATDARDWVADAVAVLDAVGSERAAVLAANESGLIALLLAATHPERVSALIVVNAFAGPSSRRTTRTAWSRMS